MPETDFEERRKKTVWQRLDELDSETAKGHERHRKRLDTVEDRLDGVIGECKAHAERLKALAEAPVDATKLMLTSRAIVTLVIGTATIAGSIWASAAGTRASIRAVETKVDSQVQAATAAAKLQDVQMATLRDAAADAKATAADAKRQYELLRYEFQSLKETVIQKGK